MTTFQPDGPRADAQVTVIDPMEQDRQDRPWAWSSGTEAVETTDEILTNWGQISRGAAQKILEAHGDDGQGFFHGHQDAETINSADVAGWLGYDGNPDEYDRGAEWFAGWETGAPQHDAAEASI